MMLPLQGILHGHLPCFAQTTLVAMGAVTVHYDVTVSAGVPWWVDWGDGTRTATIGSGASQTVSRDYVAGTYKARLTVARPSALLAFDCGGMGFTGTIRPKTDFRNLASISWANNAFTGPPPDVSMLTSAWLIAFVNNNLAGTLSAIPPAVQLWFSGYNAGIVGVVPSLTACTALVVLDAAFCGHTGYTASTLAPTITSFLLHGNALTLAAEKQILADFMTGIASRPDVVVIALDGGTNAAFDAAALATRLDILGHKPGWTISHN